MNEREKMINTIRERYDLNDPDVFSVMLQIPREEFVFEDVKKDAYRDSPLSIGWGQTMSQPYTVAFMTQLLSLKGHERVLEIGTGSGYQAAVLSGLAREVYTLEIIPQLAKKAAKTLKRLNYKNVHVKAGTGEFGWEEKSPFDAMLITAGVERKIPKALLDQLGKPGVLVAPVGRGGDKRMTRFSKNEAGKIKKEKFGIFHFVPFVEEKN